MVNLRSDRFWWDLTPTFEHEISLSVLAQCNKYRLSMQQMLWHWVSQTEWQSKGLCWCKTWYNFSCVGQCFRREVSCVWWFVYLICKSLRAGESDSQWAEVVFDCSSGWLYFLKAHATILSFRRLLTRVTAMHSYKVTNYTSHLPLTVDLDLHALT